MKNLLFVFLLITFYHAEAQCEFKYEIKKEASASSDKGIITLTLNDIDAPVAVTLYDMMDENFPAVQEKRVQPSQSKSRVVFSGLKATTYIIKVSWRSCTKTIGGLEGIKIDQK